MKMLREGALRRGPWSVVPVVAVLSFLVLVVATGLASRSGGSSTLERLPPVDALSYGPDTFGTIPPLESTFVTSVLGPDLVALLRGEGNRAAAGQSRLGTAVERAPGAESGFEETPGGQVPAPGELAKGPVLDISISVDRATAARGDRLHYDIVVRNVGDGVANRVEVTSHVPRHTSLVASPQCGGEPAKVEPGQGPGGLPSTCVDVPVPATAPGDHGIQINFDLLRPGRHETFEFAVAINPDAPSGAAIGNHAHVRALEVSERTSNEVVTVVE